MAQNSSAMYLVSTIDGKILWANASFCNWSNYSLPELVKKTWLEISQDDEDLDTDVQLAQQLSPYQLTYMIQKRYIPKNGKPQLGNLHVTRYPEFGDMEFCWCRWEPLTNGTAQALELALATKSKVVDQMTELTKRIDALTVQTDEERWGFQTVRMAFKYPKVVIAFFGMMLVLGGFDSMLGALQRLGYIPQPPVTVVETKK
jgi:PAS domain S-box-containing protein